jgi:DHA2 family multidrug resistance protein
VFIVQTMTAKQPFFDRALAFDRNFVSCNVFGFFIGILLFSTMALMPPMLQGLMGYSVFGAGLLMMWRGLGSFGAMFVVGRMVGRVDTRLILGVGLGLSAIALLQMSHFDLTMGGMPFVTSGIIQGLGIGLIFVPLSVIAFSTLAPALRPEATSVYTLVRSLGSAVGISMMQALFTNRAAVSHADMTSQVQPGSPLFPGFGPGGPGGGLISLNGEITRQAAMVGYIDVFRLMLFMTLAVMPLLFIMQPPRQRPNPSEVVVE